MKINLDPRVEPMFRGRPPHERFLAVAMLAILGAISKGGELLEAVIEEIKGTEVDWTEVVGGKALLHYNGKTRAQLLKENIPLKTIEQVSKALERRGIKMVDGDLPKAPPSQATPPKPAATKAADGKKPLVVEDGEDELLPHEQPPASGDLYAGKPLEFFNGLTRDQVLAVEGINPPTADKIIERLAGEKPKDETPPPPAAK